MKNIKDFLKSPITNAIALAAAGLLFVAIWMVSQTIYLGNQDSLAYLRGLAPGGSVGSQALDSGTTNFGSLSLSGDLTVAGAVAATGATTGSDATYTSDVAAGTLEATGAVTVGGSLRVTGTSTIVGNMTGASAVASFQSLAATGAATVTGSLRVTGTSTIVGDMTGAAAVASFQSIVAAGNITSTSGALVLEGVEQTGPVVGISGTVTSGGGIAHGLGAVPISVVCSPRLTEVSIFTYTLAITAATTTNISFSIKSALNGLDSAESIAVNCLMVR